MIFGTDSRTPGAFTGNADALVLAQLSADRTRVTLVSITRDSYVPIAGGGRGKINSAFARGGVDGLRATVSNLFGGLPIQITAQTDFTDFVLITRLLDGFAVANKVTSSVRSSVTGAVTRFPAGRLVLHGADWLIYARQRKGLPRGDLDRSERHRAVLTGMLDQLHAIAAQGPARFTQLATSLGPKVRLTGPVQPAELPRLAGLLRNLDAGAVTSLMVPVARYATVKGASVNILDDARTAALAAGLRAGDVSGYLSRYGRG
ncbi:LCP family protein [Nigerium massiliense]|uniref:LCP family protein n=1 Tax=Nigerium massiliense TaxID=1522317 RepID=UPI000694F29D|nr:LCP family protein [Nigerium massiliense]